MQKNQESNTKKVILTLKNKNLKKLILVNENHYLNFFEKNVKRY